MALGADGTANRAKSRSVAHGASPSRKDGNPMARKKSGIGLLGWLGIIVLVLLVLAYLQQHGIVHLPVNLR